MTSNSISMRRALLVYCNLIRQRALPLLFIGWSEFRVFLWGNS